MLKNPINLHDDESRSSKDPNCFSNMIIKKQIQIQKRAEPHHVATNKFKLRNSILSNLDTEMVDFIKEAKMVD